MNPLMELVDPGQERNREYVADTRRRRNYAIWHQLVVRLDEAFYKVTVLTGALGTFFPKTSQREKKSEALYNLPFH